MKTFVQASTASVIGALSILIVLITGGGLLIAGYQAQHDSYRVVTLPLCENEDGSSESGTFKACVWAAGAEGNGEGDNVVYLSPEKPIYGYTCESLDDITWKCWR
jgi:hypothetical protein